MLKDLSEQGRAQHGSQESLRMEFPRGGLGAGGGGLTGTSGDIIVTCLSSSPLAPAPLLRLQTRSLAPHQAAPPRPPHFPHPTPPPCRKRPGTAGATMGQIQPLSQEALLLPDENVHGHPSSPSPLPPPISLAL